MLKFFLRKKEGLHCAFQKSGAGFTLLEMIIAAFVVIIGLVGVFSLITQTTAFVNSSSQRLTAAYLAQEGIEIVRNIRDANWLEQRDNPSILWLDGLDQGEWEADYNDSFLSSYAERYLKFNGNFYSYDSGTDTKFKRKITITTQGADIIKVQIQMQWEDRGRTNQIIVQENLYNWR